MNLVSITKRLGKKGALKHGFVAVALIAVILSVLMAHYALSDASVYDKVNAGDYIDTGLDKTKGISMDLVEKGLTHKVLEFEITSEISAQDIQLLIAENNFDAKGGSLSRLSTISKEELVYESICNTYNLEDPINHSVNRVENCTYVQKGTKTVYEEQWVPIALKAAEKTDTASLSTFNIFGKGKYRYSFDTPIVKNGNGWGNAGTVFLKVGSGLFADKQHSSWWYGSYPYKRVIQIKNTDGYHINESINLTFDTSALVSAGKLQSDCRDLHIICNGLEYELNITGCNAPTTNITFFASTNTSTNLSCDMLYGNSTATFSSANVLSYIWDDFSSDKSQFSATLVSGAAIQVSDGELQKINGGTAAITSNQNITGDSKTMTFNIRLSGKQYHDLGLDVTGSGLNIEVYGYTLQCEDAGCYLIAAPSGESGAKDSKSWAVNTLVYYNYTISLLNHDGTSNAILSATQQNATGTMSWVYTYNAASAHGRNGLIGWYINVITANIDNVCSVNRPWNCYTYTNKPTWSIGVEEHYNNISEIALNAIQPAIAYTTDGLNCSFTVTDLNVGDTLTANISWYNGASLYNTYIISVTNGTLASNVLNAGNTTKGETWNCSVIAYDGYAYSNASSAVRYINNSVPNITNYNATSLNRTWVNYTNQPNVNFQENETVRFAVNVTDADSDPVWYSWFVDSMVDPVAHSSWFDHAWNWLSAGLHLVRVDVNDSSNAITTMAWNVNIANVVNKQWSVDYVSPPTPSDKENLTSQAVNISILVSPTLKEAALKTMFHTSSDFTGNFSGTLLNTTDNSLQLSYPALTGSYTSPIYELESNVTWGNMSWSDFLSSDGGYESQEGLAGLWRMNQETSPVLDYSGNGNDGTCTGASCPLVAKGKQGKSLNFDGINDYIDAGNASGLNSGLGNTYTLEAWIKTNSNAIMSIAGAFQGSGSIGYRLNTRDNGEVWFQAGSGSVGPYAYCTNCAYADNNWHHIAGVRNSTGISLYFDGVFKHFVSYASTNLVNTTASFRIGYTYTEYFNGSIDEVKVWNRSLSPEEVLDSYNSLMANATFQMRSCDDDACAGEDFVGSSGAGSYYTNAEYESLNNLQPNKWFQYKALLNAKSANFTSKLYNVSMKGIASSYYEDVTISKAWINWNGVDKPMSGNGYSWSYANNTLDKGGYAYRVYVNDTFGNVNMTEIRTFSVPSYNITFNVTSGEDGHGIELIDSITCDYSGFNKGGYNYNPYGPYTFPVGAWSCTFIEDKYWNKTQTFIVDGTKNIDIILSWHGGLSYEEHTQLDWLYNCWKYGKCEAYTKLSGVYENVSRIWNEFIPTNVSVVATETLLSDTLSPSSNISINYSVNVPYKKGVENQALLPIRIFYWFTDNSNNCYNQDKQNGTNRAESPYCIPLIAEYLGPNNGTTTFKVDLRPNLPSGTYKIVRSIDIDPPMNGEQTWVNYGREVIGSIKVVNPVQSESEAPVTQASTVEAKAPTLPKLNDITGSVVQGMKGAGSVPVLVGLGMLCLTFTISFLGKAYIENKHSLNSKEKTKENEATK